MLQKKEQLQKHVTEFYFSGLNGIVLVVIYGNPEFYIENALWVYTEDK